MNTKKTRRASLADQRIAPTARGWLAARPRPGADLADDLVILTAEGAAYLVEQQQPALTAEALFGVTCRAQGCTDDAIDGKECSRHQLVSAF